jgi:hypothetical protein
VEAGLPGATGTKQGNFDGEGPSAFSLVLNIVKTQSERSDDQQMCDNIEPNCARYASTFKPREPSEHTPHQSKTVHAVMMQGWTDISVTRTSFFTKCLRIHLRSIPSRRRTLCSAGRHRLWVCGLLASCELRSRRPHNDRIAYVCENLKLYVSSAEANGSSAVPEADDLDRSNSTPRNATSKQSRYKRSRQRDVFKHERSQKAPSSSQSELRWCSGQSVLTGDI